jgi:glucose uptake protein
LVSPGLSGAWVCRLTSSFTEAGYAISYGLGQGATMIAAAWGVFIWKEFAGAPRGTNRLIAAMFALFIAGLVMIILSKL